MMMEPSHHVTAVPTICTRTTSIQQALDESSLQLDPCWVIWAWLADSAGTTGTTGSGGSTPSQASARTTTNTTGPGSGIGTGTSTRTPSLSPIAWAETDIAISSSRHEFEPLTPLRPLSLSSATSNTPSTSSPSSGSGSSSLHHHNFTHPSFLFLDGEQQQQQLSSFRSVSSTTTSNTGTNSATNHNLNNTTISLTTTPFHTNFLLSSPSTWSFDAAVEDHNHGNSDYHRSIDHKSQSRDRQRRKRSNMPSSTLPPPDEPFFPNSTFSAANITANTSQWRPHTSRSGRSGRSPSPLFTRWGRRNHESNDSSSSTGRKSTSSSGSKRRPHHHDHDNDDASHRHMHNFSTSTMTRSGSSSKRQSQAGLPPPLTREEFEALPLAIQRKYFSTLERLRFAQASGIDDISQHYDQITARNFKKRLARQERSAPDNLISLRRRSSGLETRFSSADTLAFANLPEKIKKRHFTREEQTVLTRHLRASVILDAADEVVYKAGRRASKHLDVPPEMDLRAPSFPKQRNNSMDSPRSSRHMLDESRSASVPQSFYDTFRWLDEEEDLDLRLFLDDYHANLREDLPEPSKQRRPSFRRHLSISKIPFGRPSLSSRPPTRDAASSQKSPAQSPLSPSSEFHFGHHRRKSRALSLITPKHASHDSISGIDPSAAHYQDPEARLKLRVYLASPQKFDEAIEFGFPSTDVIPCQPATANEGRSLSKRQSRHRLVDDSNMKTFLDDDEDEDLDDKMSLNSDQPSVADPDSPQTPHAFDKVPIKPIRVSPDTLNTTHASKSSEGGAGVGYVQVPASSREMTLRMTLTRPDLRAHEEQIYGWQKNSGTPQPTTGGRKSPAQQIIVGRRSPQLLREDSAATTNTATPASIDYFAADGMRKESMEKIFAGIDHWNATNNNTDQNVMRRLWNRVRRS